MQEGTSLVCRNQRKSNTRLIITFYIYYLVQSTIRRFIESKVSEDSHTRVADKREALVRIVLPYNDQKSANVIRKQLADLSQKINADICPVYTSKKRSRMKLRSRKTSRLLRVNNAWCIHLNVACVMQAMSATRADTYTNELKNTKDRQSKTTSESSTI